ncbi:MAG: hypothetical protein WC654_02825 [Patescibacteria group bacterium]
MNEQLHRLTTTVLERGYLLSLGIADENGPWVADVIYVHDDDFNLYWMSTSDRRHSRALDGGHRRVAGAIAITPGPDEPDEGLQMSGLAQQIENPSSDLLRQWMEKKRKDYSVDMGIALPEHVWYKLTPDRIELIYQEKFGYERQRVR